MTKLIIFLFITSCVSLKETEQSNQKLVRKEFGPKSVIINLCTMNGQTGFSAHHPSCFVKIFWREHE